MLTDQGLSSGANTVSHQCDSGHHSNHRAHAPKQQAPFLCKTNFATQTWRASVCVLTDQGLSSGANTVSHQCDSGHHSNHRAATAPKQLHFFAKQTLPLRLGGQVFVCSPTRASALVPTLFLINVTPATIRIIELPTHPSNKLHFFAKQTLPLRLGGQVFVCSPTRASALVPTLFLINVTAATIRIIELPTHPSNKLHFFAKQTLPLRLGGQVFVCSPTRASALVPTLFLINVTAATIRIIELTHPSNKLHFFAKQTLPLRLGGQVFVCSPTRASALVPTLFLINVTAATSRIIELTHPSNKLRIETNQTLPLRLGGQAFVCSPTRASALVPTLFLINVTPATIRIIELTHPSNKLHFFAKQTLPLRLGGQVFVCSPTRASALVPTLFLINVTAATIRIIELTHPSCHSDLEGKCLCAHRPGPQLWCQHCFSSM